MLVVKTTTPAEQNTQEPAKITWNYLRALIQGDPLVTVVKPHRLT
jgi:hypothetical protein